MPLRLIDPRPPKTKNFYVRGKYLGTGPLDHSTGTDQRRVAKIVKARWEDEIERGVFNAADPFKPLSARGAAETAAPVTFLAAAVAYMQAGASAADKKRLGPIYELTGEHALRHLAIDAIDQVAIDRAAGALYPGVAAPTLNREFYTPVSAVLRRAGRETAIKRPKGWRGNKSTSWLEPVQAFALLAAAHEIDAEFGIYLTALAYTGMRLTESLRSTLGHLNIARRTLYLPKTKNTKARMVHLPKAAVLALANHPRGLERDSAERIFRFHRGGRLCALLSAAKRRAGLKFPPRQGGFHLLCHTWGTWMHRYGGLDNYQLTRTDRWADPRSSDRYVHLEVSEEARRADLLPTAKKPARRAWNGRGKRPAGAKS